MSRKTVLLICAAVFAVLSISPVYSQDTSGGKVMLDSAIAEFGNSQYSKALLIFRQLILDSKYSAWHGDAYFWLAKSYMALNQLDDCEKHLEYFLVNYSKNSNFPEAVYQKGRLLYLQKQYESAISAFGDFLKKYPETNYTANTLYWIGECYYELGHFDKAKGLFAEVVANYPTSFRVEAANYRISIIDLKERETELLKLLKWSHEEALKAREDYYQKSQTYEQALTEYQKKINALNAGETDSELLNRISILEGELERLQSGLSDAGTSGTVDSSVYDAKLAELNNKMKLIEMKEKALKLKEEYIQWIEEFVENNK